MDSALPQTIIAAPVMQQPPHLATGQRSDDLQVLPPVGHPHWDGRSEALVFLIVWTDGASAAGDDACVSGHRSEILL